MKKILNILLFVLIAIGAAKYVEKVIHNNYKSKHNLAKSTTDVARIEAERERLLAQKMHEAQLATAQYEVSTETDSTVIGLDSLILFTDSLGELMALNDSLPTVVNVQKEEETSEGVTQQIGFETSILPSSEPTLPPTELHRSNKEVKEVKETKEADVSTPVAAPKQNESTMPNDLSFILTKKEIKDTSIVLVKAPLALDTKRWLPELKKKVDLVVEEQKEKLAVKEEVEVPSHTYNLPLLGNATAPSINVKVNGLSYIATLSFASPMVQVSTTEVERIQTGNNTMHLNGTTTHKLTDGTTLEVQLIKLASIQLGDKILRNVDAIVIPNQQENIILGQSAFARLNKLNIDKEKSLLQFN